MNLLTNPSIRSLRPLLSSQRRPFSATFIRRTTPALSANLLSAPTADYLQQEELDVELPDPQNVRLLITDRTANVRS